MFFQTIYMFYMLILSWRFAPAMRKKALRWHSKSSFRLEILLCSEIRYSVTVLSLGNKSILPSSARRSTVTGRLPESALGMGKCHYWFWWFFPLCSNAFIASILILCRTCFETYHRESQSKLKKSWNHIASKFFMISEWHDFQFQKKKLKPCRKNNFRNKTWTCDSKAALQQKFHAEQKTKHELDDVACMFSSIKLHLSERTFLSILYELSGFQVLWKIMCMMEEFLPQASLVTAFLVLFSALSHP